MQALASHGVRHSKVMLTIAVPAAGQVSCTIEDNGPGIREDYLALLFNRFFTTSEGGMGLGLAICRTIIEAHDGRIDADNESTLGGARFTFTLPAGE
jgi:signal transduction histidine kinase